jgi:hypothetical protein
MSLFQRSWQVAALLLAALCCVSSSAESCSAYLFPGSVAEVWSAKVVVPRASIFGDDEGCPEAGESCKGKAYLVAGDEALTVGTHGQYRCIAFFHGGRQTTGWVEARALTSSPELAVSGDWSGRWKRLQGDAILTIRKHGAVYVAEALATYYVAKDNVRAGAADGKLTMTTMPSGIRIATFGDVGVDRTEVCRVQLRQFGAWLLVDDGATDDSNSACGGMGVTLNGIYRRLNAKVAAIHSR